MQLLDALKVVIQPWKWSGGEYVVLKREYTPDGEYMSPEEAEKARLLQYDWSDSLDLDDLVQRKRALLPSNAGGA